MIIEKVTTFCMFVLDLNTRTVGGPQNDYANSIIQTTDSAYAVFGYTNSFGAGNNDMYMVKLNTSGVFQWNRTLGN